VTRTRDLQSSDRGRRAEARLTSVGNRGRGPLRRGDLVDPEGSTVPAWTGGDRVLSYVAATDQVTAGGRSPRPGRRTSRGRHLRRSEGCSAVRLRVAARAAWCLLWGSRASTVDQVHLIDAHRGEHPTREGGLVNESGRNRHRARRALSPIRDTSSSPPSDESEDLPEGNDLLVGRVNPPAEAGACRSGRLLRSRVRSGVEQVRPWSAMINLGG